MIIKRTSAEIGDLFDAAVECADEPSKWPSQAYEQGVLDTLKWLTDEDEPNPLED